MFVPINFRRTLLFVILSATVSAAKHYRERFLLRHDVPEVHESGGELDDASLDQKELEGLKREVAKSYERLKAEGFQGMINLAKTMSHSKILGPDNDDIQERITKLEEKVAENMQPPEAPSNTERIGKNLEKLSSGINALTTGVAKMTSAYESGDWLDFAIAGIDMTASFAALAGPKGLIVSQILSIFSTILGLFRESPKEEKHEDLMRRVIREELEQFREEDLLANANGYLRSFSLLSRSLDQFRDQDENVTDVMAAELYGKAFDDLEIFGELESHIGDRCTMNMESIRKLDSSNKKEGSKVREKITEETMRCLKLADIYTQLSVMRQLMLVNIAALFSTSECSNCVSLRFNLLETIRAEQDLDMSVLSFFGDPLSELRKRFIINFYFSNPGRFPVIKAYLGKLDDASGGGFYRKGLLVCQGLELKGDCLFLRLDDANNKAIDGAEELEMYGKNTYKSLFIPKNYVIYENENGMKVIGPTAINVQKPWSRVLMKSIVKPDMLSVRVCNETNLASTSTCITIMEGSFDVDLESYWTGKVSSLEIPAGLKVTGQNKRNIRWGPYFGPQVIADVCQGEGWAKIYLERTNKTTSTMVKICQQEDFAGRCEYVASSTNLNDINGCFRHNWHTNGVSKALNIRSMSLPAGLMVTLRRYKGGPVEASYVGPTKLEVIDAYGKFAYIEVIPMIGINSG